jgi:hypothetical protein
MQLSMADSINLDSSKCLRRLRAIKLYLALLVMAGDCLFGELHAAPVASCDEVPPLRTVTQYQRQHDVTARRRGLGPDAIELEFLVVMPVMDQLAVWERGPESICLSLTTVGESARECDVHGTAAKDAAGDFIFSEGLCVIRFSIGAEGVELRASREGCKIGYCAEHGAVESATYVRSPN